MNMIGDPPVYTVTGFCEAHHIARSFFYSLLHAGRAPRITKLGRRTFITREAAAEWRTRMEQESGCQPSGGAQQ
jgi:predicted DNA-binding transcriptional regulator AlpA